MFTGSLSLSLISLRLEYFVVGSHVEYRAVPEADYTAAFAAMNRLRCLYLRTVYRVEKPQVAATVSLEQLCIEPAISDPRDVTVPPSAL